MTGPRPNIRLIRRGPQTIGVRNHQLTKDERYVQRAFGPPPVNPFKELRLKHQLSIAALERESHISKSAIVRAENGTYRNPLPSLAEFWLRRARNVTTALDIEEGYSEFQREQRARNCHYFGPSLLVDGHSAVHPMRQLRAFRPALVETHNWLREGNETSVLSGDCSPVGPAEISRALCFPLDTLQFWEKKWRQQQTVPAYWNKVLLEIGYTSEVVANFNADYEQWRLKGVERDRRRTEESNG